MTSPSFMCSTYVMELASAITGMVPSPTSFTSRSQGLARSSGVAASELWNAKRPLLMKSAVAPRIRGFFG